MMNTNLDAEKVRELKRLIDRQLRQTDVYTQIRQLVAEHTVDGDITERGASSENHVLRALREKGVIEQVISSLNAQGNLANSSITSGAPKSSKMMYSQSKPNGRKQLMHMRLLGGKGFLELGAHSDGSNGRIRQEKLVVYCHFGNQRFRSTEVACCENPSFDDDFILEMEFPKATSTLNQMAAEETNIAAEILQIQVPLHLVVIKVSEDGKREFIGGQMIEWRRVLKRNSIIMSVEVGGGSSVDLSVPKGIIDIRLELIPRPGVSLSEEDLDQQLSLERTRRTQLEREFHLNAKHFYSDFVQIRQSHRTRIVKLFAENELGMHLPVTCFVQPLRSDRQIDSPNEAARFVALLDYERNDVFGSTGKELWFNMHSFLCMARGDVENHAILLCSLLLGFGFDAYVCVGTDQKGTRLWVLTRDANGGNCFWESITGVRYPVGGNNSSKRSRHRYNTIDTVFNHERLYVNSQPTNNVDECEFDLESEANWKSMSPTKLRLVKNPLPRVPLIPGTADVNTLASSIERNLMQLIDEYRADRKELSTSFDDQMSYIMNIALVGYELERIGGVDSSTNLNDFQACVKRYVPHQHIFKCQPLQLNHSNPKRIFNSMLKNNVVEDILETQGDNVRFGVRAKIFPYPENVLSTWVIVGVQYRDFTDI